MCVGWAGGRVGGGRRGQSLPPPTLLAHARTFASGPQAPTHPASPPPSPRPCSHPRAAGAPQAPAAGRHRAQALAQGCAGRDALLALPQARARRAPSVAPSPACSPCVHGRLPACCCADLPTCSLAHPPPPPPPPTLAPPLRSQPLLHARVAGAVRGGGRQRARNGGRHRRVVLDGGAGGAGGEKVEAHGAGAVLRVQGGSRAAAWEPELALRSATVVGGGGGGSRRRAAPAQAIPSHARACTRPPFLTPPSPSPSPSPPPHTLPLTQAIESFALCTVAWGWVSPKLVPRRVDVLLFRREGCLRARVLACLCARRARPLPSLSPVLPPPHTHTLTPRPPAPLLPPPPPPAPQRRHRRHLPLLL